MSPELCALRSKWNIVAMSDLRRGAWDATVPTMTRAVTALLASRTRRVLQYAGEPAALPSAGKEKGRRFLDGLPSGF